MDEIIIVIDDVRYRGWKSFNLHNTLDAMCGSFSMTLVQFADDLVEDIRIGARLDIYIGPDQMMAGYIYTRERTMSSGSTSLTVTGRDITGDLVDCAAIVTSNYWTNAKIERIANDITKPFDIFTDIQVDDVPFSSFSIQQGETAYAAIERMCRLRGYLCNTNQFGDLVIRNYEAADASLDTLKLEVGVNVISITESLDYSKRHNIYYVRGQGKPSKKGSAWSKGTLNYASSAIDKGIDRHRPKVIISDSKSSNASTKDQALWTARTNASRAKVYTVVVQGFRQRFPFRAAIEPVWKSGQYVNLIHKDWVINRMMIISRVDYSFGPAGSTSTLTLKAPWSYQPDPNEVVS